MVSIYRRGYKAPVKEYEPLYHFIRKHASCFDGFKADDSAKVTTPARVMGKVRRKGDAVVIHVVNLDYDEKGDKMREAEDVKIAFPASLANGRQQARLLSYDEKMMTCPVRIDGEKAFVTLPALRLWTLAVID